MDVDEAKGSSYVKIYWKIWAVCHSINPYQLNVFPWALRQSDLKDI